MDVPDVPEDVTGQALDRDAHGRLRTLSKDNAEDVARHLVMAGRLIDDDPELAYRHAQVALARGGRVDVVREAAALTAYATGRYVEALREFRTVTRLSGSHEHLALVADCERGLGRPEKALEIAQSADAKGLDPMSRAELDLVVAGARADLHQFDAALLALDRIKAVDADQAKRVDEARSVIRVAAGLDAPGELAGETTAGSVPVDGELSAAADVDEVEVVVYDLEDDGDA
jgi:tetratricopeptide (TPR) repeat protein